MERNTKDLSNKVNKEQFKKGKDEVIKKQILKLNLDDVTLVDTEANLFANFISESIMNNNNLIIERHKFIYNEAVYIFVKKNNKNA